MELSWNRKIPPKRWQHWKLVRPRLTRRSPRVRNRRRKERKKNCRRDCLVEKTMLNRKIWLNKQKPNERWGKNIIIASTRQVSFALMTPVRRLTRHSGVFPTYWNQPIAFKILKSQQASKLWRWKKIAELVSSSLEVIYYHLRFVHIASRIELCIWPWLEVWRLSAPETHYWESSFVLGQNAFRTARIGQITFEVLESQKFLSTCLKS